MKPIGSPSEIISLENHSRSIIENEEKETTFQKVTTTTGAQKRAEESLSVTLHQNDRSISSEIAVGQHDPSSIDAEAQAIVEKLFEILTTIFPVVLPSEILNIICGLITVSAKRLPQFLLNIKLCSTNLCKMSNVLLLHPVISQDIQITVNLFDLYSIPDPNENSNKLEKSKLFEHRNQFINDDNTPKLNLFIIGKNQVELIDQLLKRECVLIQKSQQIAEISLQCGQDQLGCFVLERILKKPLGNKRLTSLKRVTLITQHKGKLFSGGSFPVDQSNNEIRFGCSITSPVESTKTLAAHKRAMKFDAIASYLNHKTTGYEIATKADDCYFPRDLNQEKILEIERNLLNLYQDFLAVALGLVVNFKMSSSLNFSILLTIRLLCKRMYGLCTPILLNSEINQFIRIKVYLFDLILCSNAGEDTDFFKHRNQFIESNKKAEFDLFITSSHQVRIFLGFLKIDPTLIQKSKRILKIIAKCNPTEMQELRDALEEVLNTNIFPSLEQVIIIDETQEEPKIPIYIRVARCIDKIHLENITEHSMDVELRCFAPSRRKVKFNIRDFL